MVHNWRSYNPQYSTLLFWPTAYIIRTFKARFYKNRPHVFDDSTGNKQTAMKMTTANAIFPLTKLSEDARKCQAHSAVFFGYSQLINLSAAPSTPSTKIAPRGVKIMNRNHSFRFVEPFIRYRPADRLTNKLTASQFILGYCYA